MSKSPLGGRLCQTEIRSGLLESNRNELTQDERDVLWELFVEIGRCWGNPADERDPAHKDSGGMKSSWLEFIEAKTICDPSYVGEYVNAIEIITELKSLHKKQAFRRLFLEHGIDADPPSTRLAHLKTYVVDEFIRVWVVASGFRTFGGYERGKNYNGFVRGSRYNLTERVRAYHPKKDPN